VPVAFDFTTLHMIEPVPSKRNPVKSKYLLMSPYLEGSKFERVSGDTGEISPAWREKGAKIQRITRTLDAFQHYVVAKSNEKLLIADLQGNFRL
jgi:Alpha-kinase family